MDSKASKQPNKKQRYSENKPIEITEPIELYSKSLMRWIGYILLAFSLIDYIAILVPLQLTNPLWEFQTIGQLVDHVWAPLLGLALVFFLPTKSYLSNLEIYLLRFLSWCSLILGIFYLLMVPLGINNSITINDGAMAQITSQTTQQTEQIDKLNQQLQSATTLEQLNPIAQIVNPSVKTATTNPQDLKSQLTEQIATAKNNLLTAANSAKSQQKLNLIKNSLKVNIGAILAGVSLIGCWNLTRWVRELQRYV